MLGMGRGEKASGGFLGKEPIRRRRARWRERTRINKPSRPRYRKDTVGREEAVKTLWGEPWGRGYGILCGRAPVKEAMELSVRKALWKRLRDSLWGEGMPSGRGWDEAVLFRATIST